MKYRLLYPQIERIYFKPQKTIMSKIYDRYSQFIEASMHNPNKIYMGPKAYNEMMLMASKNTPNINGSLTDLGLVMGMEVTVSSQLMNDEVIILRTME